MRWLTLVSLLVAAAGLGAGSVLWLQSGGTQAPEPGGEILARVGDWALSADSFEAEIARRAAAGGSDFATRSERRRLLDEIVKREILAANALAAGYGEHPVVRDAWQRVLVSQFREDEMARRFAPLAVSEAEVEAYYHANLTEFRKAERVRAALILIHASPKLRSEVRQRRREKAELALAAIAESRDDSTADFGAAAVRYSEDQATRYRGGDTGWILRGTPARFDPELVEAIFALAQPGDDTGLLVLPKGFAVAKLLERAPAEQRSLAEVRTRLERRLLSRKRSFAHDEFLAEMRAAVHVEIDEQWLGGAESPLPLVAHAMSPGRME